MSNMSYCRFQNTLSDLQDCYENIDDDELSKDEEMARKNLIMICIDIANDFQQEVDKNLYAVSKKLGW